MTLVWLCLTALVAGAINSVAGGGTLLTFPALIAALSPFHEDAAVRANATSTVALVLGSVAGAWGYRKKVGEARRWLELLIVPSLIGGVTGSLLVTRLDPKYFSALVPWLILTAASLFLADTVFRRRVSEERTYHSAGSIAGLVVFQLAVAIYGGYFGAGIGILMLSSLALMGIGDINRMNAVKTLLVASINGVAVVVFAIDQKVYWPYAIPMAAVSILGGYLGALGAQRTRPRAVRWIVIAIGFSLAAYYFVHEHNAAAAASASRPANGA